MKLNKYVKHTLARRVCGRCLTKFSREQQSSQARFQCKSCDTPTKKTHWVTKVIHCLTNTQQRK